MSRTSAERSNRSVSITSCCKTLRRNKQLAAPLEPMVLDAGDPGNSYDPVVDKDADVWRIASDGGVDPDFAALSCIAGTSEIRIPEAVRFRQSRGIS